MKLAAKDFSKFVKCVLAVGLVLVLAPASGGQVQPEQAQNSGTSTDLFVMLGSDFVRPRLAAKTNYNIGIGHTSVSSRRIRWGRGDTITVSL
jgi:hypothetical protein